MCGVAGIISRRPLGEKYNDVTKMLHGLKDRGPDDQGIWCKNDDFAVLGHTRLSIMDLSPTGRQPMESACGRYILSFNGEIYNHIELRDILIKTFGLQFNGTSDTEVFLNLMINLGVKAALNSVDGMFAFALWDRFLQVCTIGRDRFGEKPIFLYQHDSELVFSSEASNIRVARNLEIDERISELYFLQGCVPNGLCIFKYTEQVRAGWYYQYSMESQHIEKVQYWSPLEEMNKEKIIDYREWKNTISDTLMRNINRRLTADVDVGLFLSGGIDSSLVASYASQEMPSIKSFSIGFEDARYDESTEALTIANILGIKNHNVVVTEKDILNNFGDVVSKSDQPFGDSSIILTSIVSKLAKNYVKVVLTGDGGDEMFGGYRRHRSSKKEKSIFNIFSNLNKFIKIDSNMINGNLLNIQENPYLRVLSPELYYYYYKISYSHLDLNYMSDIARSRLQSYYIKEFHEISADCDPLRLKMLSDLTSYLPNDILTKVDRSTMKHGLEARTPFLEKDLLSYSLNCNYEFLQGENELKHGLKDILRDRVPNYNFKKEKKGFSAPIGDWLKHKLKDFSFDLIQQFDANKTLDLKDSVIKNVWEGHQSTEQDHTLFLWNIVCYQAWKNEL
ncbi:asparagine synthase (glutamine-hydrolyzing) [Amylibacter sp.]|nr:asparagine synthase (glutamine-hydrolyzing) [Amylibacter sp.]